MDKRNGEKNKQNYTDGCTKHKQQYNSCMQFMMQQNFQGSGTKIGLAAYLWWDQTWYNP